MPRYGSQVADVRIRKINPARNASQISRLAGRKVVQHANTFPATYQFLNHVRADEARSSSDQIYSHPCAFLLELKCPCGGFHVRS